MNYAQHELRTARKSRDTNDAQTAATAGNADERTLRRLPHAPLGRGSCCAPFVLARFVLCAVSALRIWCPAPFDALRRRHY